MVSICALSLTIHRESIGFIFVAAVLRHRSVKHEWMQHWCVKLLLLWCNVPLTRIFDLAELWTAGLHIIFLLTQKRTESKSRQKLVWIGAATNVLSTEIRFDKSRDPEPFFEFFSLYDGSLLDEWTPRLLFMHNVRRLCATMRPRYNSPFPHFTISILVSFHILNLILRSFISIKLFCNGVPIWQGFCDYPFLCNFF